VHILFLAPRVPWPLDTGGKIRTYHMLKGLARVHHVTVLAFWDTEVERQGAGALADLGAEIERGAAVDRSRRHDDRRAPGRVAGVAPQRFQVMLAAAAQRLLGARMGDELTAVADERRVAEHVVRMHVRVDHVADRPCAVPPHRRTQRCADGY
jgi:hypothetical protein